MDAKIVKGKRTWMWVLIALIALGLACEGVLLALVVNRANAAYPAPASDALIVLGARVMDEGGPSATLENRLDTALAAYGAGLAPAIIVCGAQGHDEPDTEANVMAAYLLAHGVPDSAIFKEDASYNTVQNLQGAKAIMEQQGFESALIVTNDYHMQRALWIARDQGLPASGGLCAPTPTDNLVWIKSMVRETLGWVNYYLFC